MLEARWRLRFQNRLVCVVFARNDSRPFAIHAAEEAVGFGILAGTSPLQHFFGEGEEGGGWGVRWVPPPAREAPHSADWHEFTWQRALIHRQGRTVSGQQRSGCRDPLRGACA